MPLVLDLRIDHDRVGSSTDPTLNGHSKYPENLDQSLNDASADKIRKYRADYNNMPPSAVSFMTAIACTSGRLHSEFVRLLFLQDHRETDRFFADSGVQVAQSNSGLFHFQHPRQGCTLRINLNIDGPPITSRTHARRVDSSALVFSLSSHRHSYIGLVFSSRFLDS